MRISTRPSRCPEELKNYFDYEAYGRDVRLNENGCFVEGGYLTRNSSGFVPQYAGPEEIPPEHRVFAYPKLNIRERLAACKEVADRRSAMRRRSRQKTGTRDSAASGHFVPRRLFYGR